MSFITDKIERSRLGVVELNARHDFLLAQAGERLIQTNKKGQWRIIRAKEKYRSTLEREPSVAEVDAMIKAGLVEAKDFTNREHMKPEERSWYFKLHLTDMGRSMLEAKQC